MPALARRDRALEGAVRRAEIALYYQPQIEPVSGRVRGVEALARWSHSDGGQALFDRARRSGLAARLSRLTQKLAIAQAASWRGPLAGLGLSVNALPEELIVPGYDRALLALCDEKGFDPARLTVEIVEDRLLGGADGQIAARQLERLRAAGVQIAIDDFGTGFSSLSYLAWLPIDTIKIDRGLIDPIARCDRSRRLVRGLIALSRDLELTIIVEGVESTEQLALLAGWGCDLYQGFQGAGPLDELELARFVASSIAAAAA